jgi:hypothetical protein
MFGSSDVIDAAKFKILIRDTYSAFHVHGEPASWDSLYSIATGEDLCPKIKETLRRLKTCQEKLTNVITDGGRNMAGRPEAYLRGSYEYDLWKRDGVSLHYSPRGTVQQTCVS